MKPTLQWNCLRKQLNVLKLSNVINYYGSDDWQIKAFAKICRSFCDFEINKEKQVVTFILDTDEKKEKFQYAFEHFNWND